ncbi:HCP-like protein [Rhizophagus irregularis]|uniref:HCP-like protein n=1 Tax=Rhizophagus irregularis TaxID=588596 RepID=A0A2N0PQA5_9GLOM|nr:HCP-like protein [Rhizophagus irregularis]
MTSSNYTNDLDYDEFQNIIEISKGEISIVCKADYAKHNIRVALKSLNPKELIQEIKQICKVNNHPNINHLLGTTKDTFGNDILVLEYANEGNLRDYLKNQFAKLNWSKKIDMALDVTQGLMCLHSKNIVHRNLHANNILVNDGILKIADLAHSAQLFEDSSMTKTHTVVEYTDPKYLFDPINYKLNMKSDIYSLSILLWELSSEYPPYSEVQKPSNQLRHDIINGLREESVENTPIKYQQLYQKCWDENPDQRSNIFEVFKVLNQLKIDNIDDEITVEEKRELTDQEIIQKLKLNHGLFLNDYIIKPSEQAIYDDDGELDMSLYDEQPLVYTSINSFDTDFKTSFQPYDVCINFPFAEITFEGNLSDKFLNYKDTDGKLNEFYGHFFSEKVLVGGQLFIKDLNKATSIQIHHLKMHLNWAYNSAKYVKNQNQLCNINMQLEIKIETSDGKEITTTKELLNWMKRIYQENMIDVISYLYPISVVKLKDITQLVEDNFEDFDEKVIKVANYKNRLNFNEWIKDSMYVKLPEWINNFNLFQGLIVNKNFKIENAKKVFVDLIKYPYLESKDNFCLKFTKSTNKSNKSEISSNSHILNSIFHSKINMNDEKLKNYENDSHFIINYEQYEISLPQDHVTLSERFKQDIEKAIKHINPYKILQDVFNDYGYLFPQKIILGKSFKYISTEFSTKFDQIYSKIMTIESLELHLRDFEIPYLSTQNEDIEINKLSNFIQEHENLEIIEYDNIVNLYDMLQQEQQKQIDIIFEDDYKVIMAGIDDLKNLNDDDSEHYKRINIHSSLRDQNYEVFGSVISNNSTSKRIKEFSVKFRFYDSNGFTAIIRNISNLKNPETQHFKITECRILWIIVGKPLKLSVFSSKNREFQIICINESILLQPDKSYYEIKTPFQLSQGHMISINTYHPPINDEPADLIEFIKWSHNSIIFRSNSILEALNVSENNVDIDHEGDILLENFSIELHICILSNFKKLNIDNINNEENGYPLDLIGNILTKETFIEDISEDDINGDDVNDSDFNIIVDQIMDFLLNEKNFTFDESKRVQVMIENYITGKNMNLKNMLDWLLNNQNNSNNIFLLGYFYCFVIKTSDVYKKAFDLLYSTTNNKNVIHYKNANLLAKYYTGICYLNGMGIEKSNVKAFKYFEQLFKEAEENYVNGMVMLGYCYINGIGTEINKKKVLEFYEKAANKGNIYAQNQLGLLYKSGIGIEKDLNKAIFWIKRSAKESIDGKDILNTLYTYSRNVEKDDKNSFLHVKKEVEKGDKEAIYNLGKYYEYGVGGKVNKDKAFELYKQAADNEFLEAIFKVGNCYYNGIGIVFNKNEAFKYYERAANKEHKIAQNNLGILYENGDGTEKNLKQAIYWYKKSAENGYKDGYYNLGLCYEFKKGIKSSAFEFYKMAAEYDHLDALFKLGYFYSKGIGIEINDKEAFEFYKKAAIKGHNIAQNKLGVLYENGKGTEKKLIKAFYWYKKSANNQYNIAYYNLGRCYENGIGIELNKSKAFKFYNKAAKKEHLDAIFKIAIYYSNGIGTEKNMEKAFYWYQKAAESERIIEAQNNLGYLYEKGKGTEKNMDKAFYWYQKAAKKEYIEAQNKLGYLYKRGEGTEKNMDKAFYWYQKAAEKEHIEAQNNLGYLYEKGEGIKKNFEKSFYWYQKAAKKNNKYAQYNLGHLYEKGKGVKKDLEKAFYWYQKAAENEYNKAQYNFGYFYEKSKGIKKNIEKAFYWYQKAIKNKYIIKIQMSGNKKIDDLIEEMHLKISFYNDSIFEWISYNQFYNIKEISKSDFITEYLAIWKDGPLYYNYFNSKDYIRKPDEKVFLKCFHNLQNITNEFLNEVKISSINNNSIPKIFGISQNPNTKNYIIVFQNMICDKCNENYIYKYYSKWCKSCF